MNWRGTREEITFHYRITKSSVPDPKTALGTICGDASKGEMIFTPVKESNFTFSFYARDVSGSEVVYYTWSFSGN